jgi:hypothetical protein
VKHEQAKQAMQQAGRAAGGSAIEQEFEALFGPAVRAENARVRGRYASGKEAVAKAVDAEHKVPERHPEQGGVARPARPKANGQHVPATRKIPDAVAVRLHGKVHAQPEAAAGSRRAPNGTAAADQPERGPAGDDPDLPGIAIAADRPDAAHKVGAIAPFVPREIPQSHHPKKHYPGDLKRGDSVWYRGERFYIEYAPDNWIKGVFARICSIPVRGNVTHEEFEHVKEDAKAESFCCHVDMLERAPEGKNRYAAPPTRAVIERKERAVRGVRDVGDQVAEMLRGKELDGVYKVAAEYLAEDEAGLRKKYAHLNPGGQRMTLGNRMRAKWKRLNAAP